MDRVVVVKFHINIANVRQRKIMVYHSLFTSYFYMFRGGAFFPDTGFMSLRSQDNLQMQTYRKLFRELKFSSNKILMKSR